MRLKKGRKHQAGAMAWAKPGTPKKSTRRSVSLHRVLPVVEETTVVASETIQPVSDQAAHFVDVDGAAFAQHVQTESEDVSFPPDASLQPKPS